MITVDRQVVIDRPVADVFDYLADATHDPEWCPPVQEVTQVEGDGPGPGARYTLATSPGPFDAKGVFEIVFYEPGRRVEFEGTNDMARFHYWYALEPTEGGTRVHMVSKLELGGWRVLLTPIIKLASERNADEQFRILKQILEEDDRGDR